MTVPILPDSAPFTPQQRAWLNGFFAGVFGLAPLDQTASAPKAPQPAEGAQPVAEPPAEEQFPWHDPALPLSARLEMAADKPLPRRLMAAMAQLDCGACGYVCRTYAEAIAGGEEKDLTRCSPGGSETAKALKQLLATSAGQMGSLQAGAGECQTSRKTADVCSAATAAPGAALRSAKPGTSRSNPFPARIVEVVRLTHPDSAKDTRHVVLDLLDSGLTYEPGDSLGVLPMNAPELVAGMLEALGSGGTEEIALAEGTRLPLAQALATRYALTRPRPALLELLARSALDARQAAYLGSLAEDEAEDLLTGCDVVDLLTRFPSARPPLEELLAALGPLQPRLYSISSSLKAHPGQVHLTVGVVRYESRGKWFQGVASTFLGLRCGPGETVPVFIQPSKFRLPADPDVPIIMVGPGTGIAPFRAFLQERQATGARGKNWLFFGNQHFDYDFLYRAELDGHLDAGLLTRLEIAFSRDRAEKVYVQDRMLQSGAELWAWLEEGAHFYVCGDGRRMAVDVEAALRRIIAHQGRLSEDEARVYVAEMARAKRYQRDVY